MRQAIVTKFLAPTDHRCSRIKATAQAGSVTIAWDHELDVEPNHKNAARALCRKYGWNAWDLAGGSLPDDTGYAFVIPDRAAMSGYKYCAEPGCYNAVGSLEGPLCSYHKGE